MTQMTIVAKSAGADVRYAAEISFVTILLGILVIPLAMTAVTLWE